MTRVAVVRGSRGAREVSAYLPANYRVTDDYARDGRILVRIEGTDENGWTLHDYVIPRLASGLMFAEEIHP